MVAKKYVRNNSTNYLLISYEVVKEGDNSIDTTTFELSRSNSANFEIGDDVSIGYLDGSGSFVAEFSGDIVKKEINETLKCVMESYGGRLNRQIISEIYENKSPEYIAEDMITTYTTLNYASTATSGKTITKFVVNDESIASAMARLLDLLSWQMRTDNSKNFYFEPKGETVASVTLTVNQNAFLQTDWRSNPNKLINSVSFLGGNAKFNTHETFTATAAQTEFTVSYVITGNVRVLVNSVEKVGGQEGSTGTYDYTANYEQKKITFESGLSNGDTVDIYYEYNIPIKITAKDESSIATYGEFSKKITDKNVQTMSDARSYVNRLLDSYSTPTHNAELWVDYDTDIDVGEQVYITDTFNSIEGNFVVTKLKLEYPSGKMIIEVGTPELKLLDWNTDVDKRLKALEQAQDNSDIIQKFISILNTMNLKVTRTKLEVKYRTKGDSFILDDPDSEFDDGVHKFDWQGSAWTQHYIDEA